MFCNWRFLEPVIRITTARDARTNKSIPRVFLDSMRIHGSRPVSLQPLVRVEGASGIVLENETIQCTVQCAFGNQEGPYEFLVSAPGYHSRLVTVDARYKNYRKGCPEGTISGSTEVALTLEPM